MTASRVGAGSLTGTALRRDRVLVRPLAARARRRRATPRPRATGSLYPRVADRVSAAEAINASPAVVALYGPIVDVPSLGELAMTKLTVLYAVFVALLFLVLVRRHTRTEEESGQAELLGGTAVGRDAPLVAAVARGGAGGRRPRDPGAVVDVAGGLPVVGSVAFGASWAGIGLVAAGMTAVRASSPPAPAPVRRSPPGAIGVLFLLRAVGDTTCAAG